MIMYNMLTIFLIFSVSLINCAKLIERDAPYPPSGFRPTGRQFPLPEPTTTESFDTENISTENNYINEGNEEQPKNLNGRQQILLTRFTSPNQILNRNNNNDVEILDNTLNDAQNGNQGIYYLYLPNGQLQKVIYTTEEDPIRMENKAFLQYRAVEPINGPIYTLGAPNSDLIQILQ